MKIDNLILGAYETNCYIVRNSEASKDCIIIDTGLEADKLIDFLAEHKLNPLAVVLTHGHADHIMGIPVLRKSYRDIKVYIHKLDAPMLTKASSNLSMLAGKVFKTEPADILIEEPNVIDEADIKLEVLHTPGHTQGGICLYARENSIIFVGDTLFADSIGRTDFPGGDMTQLLTAIKEKLLTLPEETVVYTGHGPSTTIANEKAYNQYLQ